MEAKGGEYVRLITSKFIGGMKCFREHGLIYTAKVYGKKILKRILPESFLQLNRIFQNHILAGYHIYEKIISKYGDDLVIFACAPMGTGDYYLCGMYLKAWLDKHAIEKYVFLTSGGSRQKVTELFSVYKNHTYIISLESHREIRSFRGFLRTEKCNFIYLDHQAPFMQNRRHSIASYNLMGYKGLNILDFYMYYGFQISAGTTKSVPEFTENHDHIRNIFIKNHLVIGKTALLSPYSASQKNFLLPNRFWENIVDRLQAMGYTVCTNCVGKERPIRGTPPILLSYRDIVPFLNLASAFVGLRSGLCDIISTSVCKKIVLHSFKNGFWPDGNSIAYTGLLNMGLCDDVLEEEYSQSKEQVLVDEIISYILSN